MAELDGALVLHRPGRARLDIAARTRLPDAGRARVAHQVRQDVWRALRGLRGFSPVVRVTRDAGGLEVTAGGQCDRPAAGAEGAVRRVLEDPVLRARWIARARRRAG